MRNKCIVYEVNIINSSFWCTYDEQEKAKQDKLNELRNKYESDLKQATPKTNKSRKIKQQRLFVETNHQDEEKENHDHWMVSGNIQKLN